MTELKRVGYAVLSASGRTLKLFEGSRFIGLLSIVDLEKCKKSRNFVATIIKYDNSETLKLDFGVDLKDTDTWRRL